MGCDLQTGRDLRPCRRKLHRALNAGLDQDIQALGLSIAKASKGFGLTQQQFYQLVRGKSAITPEMAIQLEKAIGGTSDIWLRAQLAPDLAKVRAHEAAIVPTMRHQRSANSRKPG